MPEFWNVRQLSRTLDADERLVGKAVVGLTPVLLNGRQCYDLAEAVPAILRRKWGLDQSDDPAKLAPWDRLNFYKSERERLALARDSKRLLPMSDYRQVTGLVLEIMAPLLNQLADELAEILNDEGAALARRYIAAIMDRFQESLEL